MHFTLLRNLSKPGEILFGPPQSYGAGDLTDWAMSFAVTAAQLNDDNGDGQVDDDDDLDLAIANGYADGVSVVLNDVAPGAHRVTLTGVEPVGRLDFGFRQPGFAITPTSGLVTTEAGGTAEFASRCARSRQADVTVDFRFGRHRPKARVVPASLTFTPENWNDPQTLTVTGVDDDARRWTTWSTRSSATAAVSTDADYHGLTPERRGSDQPGR